MLVSTYSCVCVTWISFLNLWEVPSFWIGIILSCMKTFIIFKNSLSAWFKRHLFIMQIAFFTTFRLYRVAIWDTLSSMFRKIFKILHVEWRNSSNLPERNYENQLNLGRIQTTVLVTGRSRSRTLVYDKYCYMRDLTSTKI